MQVAPILTNKTNFNANSQKQVAFSGVKEFARQPELDNLIRNPEKGAAIYPVIKKIATSIADNVKGCWIALTGNDVTTFKRLVKKANNADAAFNAVVANAKKSGLYEIIV